MKKAFTMIELVFAIAESIPMITITNINSIIVNAFFIIYLLKSI
jgi:transposase